MRWRRKNVAIENKCTEATFSLTGEEGSDSVKGVEVYKLLGRPQDRSDDDWTANLRNIRKEQHVWGCIGKLLRMEGADPSVS